MTAWATMGTASQSASVSVTVDPPPVDSGGACGGSAPLATGTGIATRSGPMATVCYPPPPGGAVSVVLVMNHDTLNPLHPRIRGMTVNDIVVPERQPDTASIQVSVAQNGTAVPAGTPVTVRAEWLPSTGGHAHMQTVLPFESSNAPKLTQPPEQGKPLMGYFFVSASDKRASFTAGTNQSGFVETKLVAGYMSGRARIIASVGVNGQTVADTVIVAYAVPGLIKLQDSMPQHVYWIGGTTYHHQGDNFYVQDSIDQRLRSIAISMKGVVNGDSVFLQYNDGSLPAGGTFTVWYEPIVYEDPFKVEPQGHQSHNTGLDQDIGWCYAKYHGDDGQVNRVKPAACKSPGGSTSLAVSLPVLKTYACELHGAPKAHSNNHYHIRFAGSTDAMPVSLCPNP